MRIAGIVPESIVDGPGFRYTIFFQGCPHHCEGCHNPETWGFDEGYEMSVKDIVKDIEDHQHISGVTFSGGEPFSQLQLLSLAEELKKRGYHIMSYSGYTYEQLEEMCPEILEHLDILVDGRFELKKRNLTLKFRGSENQRIIDLNKTREKGEVVLWEENPGCENA